MNSIVSLSHLRPVFSSSFFKRTIYVGPVFRKSLLSQNVAKKLGMSSVGQAMECSFTPKRYFNEWVHKTTMKMRAESLNEKNDHGHVWIMERLTALASLTSFIAMFLHPCENGELFFALMLSSHVHFGVEAIMVDYLRPVVVGNLIPKLIPVLAFVFSGSLIMSLMWVAIYGNGIAGSLQQLWYLDPLKEPYDDDESKLHFPEDSKFHLPPE